MTRLINSLLVLMLSLTLICCHATRKFSTAVNKKDTTITSTVSNAKDSSGLLAEIKNDIFKNHIEFKTFSAKIKLQYEDGNGKQPDVNAFIRMSKDSVIWMSIVATFLNVEAFRNMVTKDSIFIL